jgi:polyisoprenoid-binding protein YceI
MEGNAQEGRCSGMTKISFMSMLACLFVTVTAWAQNWESRIDHGYSTASLGLASSSTGISWNIGIAKVSGTVTLNDDLDKDVFNLDIYPARQGSRRLEQNGGFRDNSFADLSRYTLMNFHSSGVTRNREGKLAVTGKLSVTQVQREANIVWNNAYSGPDYGAPVAETTSHQVTFVFEAEQQTTATVHNQGPEEMSALATIDLRNFPALRSAWLDSVWPIVVENEHCEMPQVRGSSMRDYAGAVCTGTPIEVTPLSTPPQRIGTDYPEPNEVTAPANDAATILVHLRLAGGR